MKAGLLLALIAPAWAHVSPATVEGLLGNLASALPPLSASAIEELLSSLGPAPASDPRFQKSVPPGPGDVRSPCPGLNTLANHGFLNHNGKNMTVPGLLVGMAQGLNIGPDFGVVIGAAGLLASPNPLGGSFDLDQLDQHNFPIEHDGSLSRQDAYFGNDHSFYNPNWQMVLSYYKGMTQTSLLTTAQARYARTQNSATINPTFTYGAKEFTLAYGESSLYTQTMSSPLSNGVANLDYVRSLFENETLPFALGWRPSLLPITLASLGEEIVGLYTALPPSKFLPEGVSIVVGSYKDVLEQEIGGKDLLGNLTQGISNYIPGL